MTIALDRPTSPEHVVPPAPRIGSPHRPARPGRKLRLATWITLGIGVAIWLMGMLVLGLAVGPTGFALCIGLALLPLPMVLAAFRWIDRAEPEPARYLVVAFGWGATIAVGVGVAAEVVLGGQLWLTAPIIEEFAKGSILVLLLLCVRSQFDGIIDGVVYAGFVAAGFAFTENIGYIATAYKHGLTGHGHVSSALIVFAARGVITPFSHPLFTVMFGVGLGISAVSARRAVRIIAPLIGFGAATGLHMFWDFALLHGRSPSLVLAFVGFFGPLFIAMIWIVSRIRKRELRATENHLRVYAQHGWFADPELHALCSFKARRHARRWAAFVHGHNGKRAMTDVQCTATKLGLLRRKLAAGRPVSDFAARQHALLMKLTEAKALLAPAATNHPFGVAAHTPWAPLLTPMYQR
jgi:protease PrsW